MLKWISYVMSKILSSSLCLFGQPLPVLYGFADMLGKSRQLYGLVTESDPEFPTIKYLLSNYDPLVPINTLHK